MGCRYLEFPGFWDSKTAINTRDWGWVSLILIFQDLEFHRLHYKYLFKEPGYLQGPLLMGNQLLFKTSNADGPLCGFSTLPGPILGPFLNKSSWIASSLVAVAAAPRLHLEGVVQVLEGGARDVHAAVATKSAYISFFQLKLGKVR